MFAKSLKIIVTIVTIELCLLASPSFQSEIADGYSVVAANRGDFNYQASLRGQDSIHYCAGAIISDRWVLTSATCIRSGGFIYYNRYSTTIKLGGHDVREGYSYLCDLIIMHERYSERYEYDAALARSTRPILFNKFIQPIPYYKGSLIGSESSECQTNDAVAIGWGFAGGRWTGNPPSPFITYINVTILSRSGCEALWQDTFEPSNLPSTVLCTKYKPGNVMNGTCYHEYGLPLSTFGTRVLFGIFAGYPYNDCTIASRPNLYTRTADLADWIFKITNVDGVTSL